MRTQMPEPLPRPTPIPVEDPPPTDFPPLDDPSPEGDPFPDGPPVKLLSIEACSWAYDTAGWPDNHPDPR